MIRTKIISNSTVELKDIKTLTQLNKLYSEIKDDNNRLQALQLIKENFDKLTGQGEIFELQLASIARLIQIMKSYEFFFTYPLPEYIIRNTGIYPYQKFVFEYAQSFEMIDKLGVQDRVNIVIKFDSDIISKLKKLLNQLDILFSLSKASYTIYCQSIFYNDAEVIKVSRLKLKKGKIKFIRNDEKLVITKEFVNEYLVVVNHSHLTHIGSIGVIVGELTKSEIPVIGRSFLTEMTISQGVKSFFSNLKFITDSYVWSGLNNDKAPLTQDDLIYGFRINSDTVQNSSIQVLNKLFRSNQEFKILPITPLSNIYKNGNQLYSLTDYKNFMHKESGSFIYAIKLVLTLNSMIFVLLLKFTWLNIFKKFTYGKYDKYFNEIVDLEEYYRRKF